MTGQSDRPKRRLSLRGERPTTGYLCSMEPEDRGIGEQSEAELQAHFGAEGPVVAATAWLEAVLGARDYAAAWRLTDPEYRASRARDWVLANASDPTIAGRDLNAIAAQLAEVDSRSSLWSAFAQTELEQFAAAWPHVDLDAWGWASRPRPYAPEFEVVLFIPTEAEVTQVKEATLVSGLQLLMHHTPGGWLMAGQPEPE